MCVPQGVPVAKSTGCVLVVASARFTSVCFFGPLSLSSGIAPVARSLTRYCVPADMVQIPGLHLCATLALCRGSGAGPFDRYLKVLCPVLARQSGLVFWPLLKGAVDTACRSLRCRTFWPLLPGQSGQDRPFDHSLKELFPVIIIIIHTYIPTYHIIVNISLYHTIRLTHTHQAYQPI